jgi:hypothetical protein
LWRCRNHFPKSIDVIAELHPTTWYGIIHLIDLNSFTTSGANMIFVRSQPLIDRNVAKLFSSKRGILHLNEACCINEVSRGSGLGPKILIEFSFGLL